MKGGPIVAAGDGWITEAELLASLDPSVDQPDRRALKELRRAGVLQPAKQCHVEGIRGSVTVYPAEAAQQLQRVLELRGGERRFDELRFQLWWEGFWVEPALLRETLLGLLDDAGLGEWRGLVERYPNRYDFADYVLLEIRAKGTRNPLFRHLRGRLPGRRLADVETVIYALVLILLGEEPAWQSVGDPPGRPEPDPDTLTRRATGYQHLETEQHSIGSTVFGPLLPVSAKMSARLAPLRRAGLIPLTNAPRLLASANQRDLDQARDDTRLLVEPLVLFAHACQRIFGADALGLSLLTRMEPSPENRTAMLTIMLGMRRTWTDTQKQNRDDLVHQLKRARPVLTRLARTTPKPTNDTANQSE